MELIILAVQHTQHHLHIMKWVLSHVYKMEFLYSIICFVCSRIHSNKTWKNTNLEGSSPSSTDWRLHLQKLLNHMAVICAQLWSCKAIVLIVLLFSCNILCTLDTCVYTEAFIVLCETYVKGKSWRKYWGNQKEVSLGIELPKEALYLNTCVPYAATWTLISLSVIVSQFTAVNSTLNWHFLYTQCIALCGSSK